MYTDLIEVLLELGYSLDYVFIYLTELLGSETAATEAMSVIGMEDVNF